MSYESTGRGALDYFPCRYGKSRLVFRGPKRSLTGDYALFLGGTETYGRFVAQPFPALIEAETGLTCVNFGWPNAGVDAFLNDGTVLEAAAQARVTVVQAMGAQNMTNRYYSVHPRRNDRFLAPSRLMRQAFRDVDFTEFHFNRHMLSRLRQVAPDRYAVLRDGLKDVWLLRMRQLLRQIGGRTILLWFADHAPEQEAGDPLFVDRRMIEALRPLASEVVEVVASAQALAQGTEGMVFSPLERPVAAGMMGPAAHSEVAARLAEPLRRLMAR